MTRFKLLWKLIKLSGKAEEVELEWQRIQQDAHDYQYAFNANPNDDSQGKLMFRKGVAEGIKWCVNRFS